MSVPFAPLCVWTRTADESLPDLSYFEDDDEKLKQVEESYRKGEMMTGELKKMAITLLQEYVGEFQTQRKEVTEEIMRQYMTPRKLEYKGNPNPKPKQPKEKKQQEQQGEGKDGKQANATQNS